MGLCVSCGKEVDEFIQDPKVQVVKHCMDCACELGKLSQKEQYDYKHRNDVQYQTLKAVKQNQEILIELMNRLTNKLNKLYSDQEKGTFINRTRQLINDIEEAERC